VVTDDIFDFDNIKKKEDSGSGLIINKEMVKKSSVKISNSASLITEPNYNLGGLFKGKSNVQSNLNAKKIDINNFDADDFFNQFDPNHIPSASPVEVPEKKQVEALSESKPKEETNLTFDNN